MIIHAASIHSGGGKILLDQLLIDKELGEVSALICDSRYEIPKEADSALKIIVVRPTLISRWKAEYQLKKLTEVFPNQIVLCFSNLPPAFRLNAKVILYLQNALLLPNIPLYFNSIKSGLRTIYEKLWLNIFWKNIDEIWVQTLWMKDALAGTGKPIQLRPIPPKLPIFKESPQKRYDFITVSGSASHKRLNNLLKAWELMPSPQPSLLVITDQVEKNVERFKDKNITFKVNLSRDEIFKSYLESKCLILTSKLESYCLPIFEAIHFKLKLIVPDEPYAKESCNPDIFINPDDPILMQSDIDAYYRKTVEKK